jgi:hypothetical protein
VLGSKNAASTKIYLVISILVANNTDSKEVVPSIALLQPIETMHALEKKNTYDCYPKSSLHFS